MRLDLELIQVNDVRFGARTAIVNDALIIDRADLVSQLEREPLFERVEIELAHPGESCRIIRVLDVVEPRYRMKDADESGKIRLVGQFDFDALEKRFPFELRDEVCAIDDQGIVYDRSPRSKADIVHLDELEI